MQLWKGRFKKELSKTTNDFNSSIPFDSRMYREDIKGSIAHATMLGKCGIISEESSKEIIKGLNGILADIDSGKLKVLSKQADFSHAATPGWMTDKAQERAAKINEQLVALGCKPWGGRLTGEK